MRLNIRFYLLIICSVIFCSCTTKSIIENYEKRDKKSGVLTQCYAYRKLNLVDPKHKDLGFGINIKRLNNDKIKITLIGRYVDETTHKYKLNGVVKLSVDFYKDNHLVKHITIKPTDSSYNIPMNFWTRSIISESISVFDVKTNEFDNITRNSDYAKFTLTIKLSSDKEETFEDIL